MKAVILQLRGSLGSQCLPSMRDPDRNRSNGSDLLGTCRQQRCTDKPSQDVPDPVCAWDRGPRLTSDFLSSPDFGGILWLARRVPSFSQFLTRLRPLSSLALPPSQQPPCSPSLPKRERRRPLPRYCWSAEGVITG